MPRGNKLNPATEHAAMQVLRRAALRVATGCAERMDAKGAIEVFTNAIIEARALAMFGEDPIEEALQMVRP